MPRTEPSLFTITQVTSSMNAVPTTHASFVPDGITSGAVFGKSPFPVAYRLPSDRM